MVHRKAFQVHAVSNVISVLWLFWCTCYWLVSGSKSVSLGIAFYLQTIRSFLMNPSIILHRNQFLGATKLTIINNCGNDLPVLVWKANSLQATYQRYFPRWRSRMGKWRWWASVHPARFPSIPRRTHGRNGPTSGMLVYPDHFQKVFDFGQYWPSCSPLVAKK